MTQWARCAVVFEPADPPRAGSLVFWRPDGGPLPADDVGAADELTVAVPDGDTITVTRVPARRLPVGAALPLLAGMAPGPDPHPAAGYWSAATTLALHLVARGRLLPGVSPAGFDAWRVGPFDADDLDRVGALAAAMPGYARATPLPGTDDGEVRLPDAYSLLRGFLDAVADELPRTTATDAYAAREPQRVDRLRDWAAEVAAGVDAGVRVSVRLTVPDDDPTGPWQAIVQVHGLADPATVADVPAVWAGVADGFPARAAQDVVLSVRRAARVWEPLGRLLKLAVPDRIVLGDDEVTELVAGAAQRLAAAGVAVYWPAQVNRQVEVRAVVGGSARTGPGFAGGAALSLDWQVVVSGEPLSAPELSVLAQARQPVVRLRDRWVLVTPQAAASARRPQLPALPAVDALAAALSGSVEVDGRPVEAVAQGWLAALRQRLADPDTTIEAVHGGSVAAPGGLAATLRDYQLRGLRWLVRMTSLGLGACLADDMGLGKTVTLIALHLHRQTDSGTAGPTLVVCPATLLGNWEREIGRFAPGVPVHRFHGPERSLAGVGGGFVLTTYATMRLDAARLAGFGWALLVADEAQHVKNAGSQAARALRQVGAGVPAAARVALTGTPVENNLDELWAILDWVTPGLLGGQAQFRRRWAAPVQAGDPAAAHRFARLVGPFLLRRRKSDPDVVPELPAKTETDQPVALTTEQAQLYAAVVTRSLAAIAGATGIARRGAVVSLLTGLKQICNHPAQYLREAEPVLAGRSGKLELLDELVDAIVAGGGAVLVFTQYVAMGRLLRRHLRDRGVGCELLHGGLSLPRREELVARFSDGAVPVFLLSLKAAGTGLNLTRADHVIHFDRWWNPAVEDQATDRAYRIGQTRPVQVHRLVAEGTVEDRIAAMLRGKRELADAVLRSGTAALTELSDADLADLVALR